MNFFRLLLASAFAATISAPVSASAIGAPFLTVDSSDVSTASILDFFDIFGPSGVKQITLAGTISSTIGAPSLVGETFDFRTVQGASPTAELTLGATTISGFDIFDGSTTGSYEFDPFQDGPGDLNFSVFVIPPLTEPVIGTFDYGGDWSEWPDRTAMFPEIEILISVYLNGPLPTRFFDDGFGGFDYIEGDLSVDRITLGTVGGDRIGVIPLPAGFPLLMVGLAALAILRRRSA